MNYSSGGRDWKLFGNSGGEDNDRAPPKSLYDVYNILPQGKLGKAEELLGVHAVIELKLCYLTELSQTLSVLRRLGISRGDGRPQRGWGLGNQLWQTKRRKCRGAGQSKVKPAADS